MEKGTTRHILFDKKAHSAPTERDVLPSKKEKKEAAEKKEEKKQTQNNDNQSEQIIRWLENHDLIKIRALCITAGLDPGNFHRWINVKKEIPKDVIEKITPILKDYGFEDGV